MGNAVLIDAALVESLRSPSVAFRRHRAGARRGRGPIRRCFAYRLNLWGVNLGGGAVGFLSDRVGVRFDLRYFQNISSVPDEDLSLLTLGDPLRLRYWTASFGVVFRK